MQLPVASQDKAWSVGRRANYPTLSKNLSYRNTNKEEKTNKLLGWQKSLPTGDNDVWKPNPKGSLQADSSSLLQAHPHGVLERENLV